MGLFKLTKTKKKARVSPSAVKVVTIVFFDCRGMIYVRTLMPKTSVSGAQFCSVLETLVSHIRRKEPQLVGHWMFYHNNVNVANIVIWFLGSKSSPLLVPCDFFCPLHKKRQF